MFSISGASPAPGESLVSVDTTLEFTIVNDGSGIDINTLIVEVGGFRAIDLGIFQAEFQGTESSITLSDDNYIVVIDPEFDFHLGQVYDLKIQVKNNDEDYFNTNYSFKTIPEEPILVESSPRNHQILTSPQIIYLEFEDIIDGVEPTSITVSINGLNYLEDGQATSDHNGSLTDVVMEGTTAKVRIDPLEPLKNGKYLLRYQAADTLNNKLISEIEFEVVLKEVVLPTFFPQTGFLGYYQGIDKASDIGQGDALWLKWNKPIKRIYRNDIFVLIYENESRLNVFDSPKYLGFSENREAIIRNLKAGLTLSYGARAFELPADVLNPFGMVQVDSDFYLLPESTQVAQQFDIDDNLLFVEDTTGYPEAGLLIVGREVIRYTAVDRINHSFSIPINGRGLVNTVPGIYLVDDEVNLFLKCTDLNTVIVMATPTHQDGYGLDRFVEGEGVVVSDFSANDSLFFQGYDFCGFHDGQPNQTLTGKDDCGSYLGGEVNGFRGFDLYERMLNQEEVLLETTGEPVILLKRIWNGTTCQCMDSRKVSPKIRSCQECFGTGFVGGYTQYNYPRRQDRRILVSFDEAPEDLFYGEKENLQQDYEPSGWTLPIPAIRDRDVIIRFDLTEQLAFIYEVLNVSREVIFNRRYGRQKLAMKRMDKTDILSTFPLDLTNIP